MKKGFLTMVALMLGMTGMMAQTVVSAGAGDVTLRQGDKLEVNCEGEFININNDKIVLTSYKDYDLTLPNMRKLSVTGAGDVESNGVLHFPYMDIIVSGAGDASLEVESDTIKAVITGVGDLKLKGHCDYLQATITGIGDLAIDQLEVDSLVVNRTSGGSSSWEWKWEKSESLKREEKTSDGWRIHKNLLFNADWNGVEAGLNMLLGPDPNGQFNGDYSLLEQRTMRSWNFNFNIADVGLAFSRTHRAGIFTGIGLGWNNFSFNHPVRLEKAADGLVCHPIDETLEGRVERSKLGVLYLQAPLMVEFRPTRKTFVAIGVTGGFRIDTWTKIKFNNGVKIKTHEDYYINRFKLDASLRAGGRFLGFFANYNLLPFFEKGKAPNAHSLSFGLSLNF